MKHYLITQLLAVVLLTLTAFHSVSAQTGGLHLIVNVNDDQDHYPVDAGRTMEEAVDRIKPQQIDSDADWYFVLFEESSSIESLGLPVKGYKAPGGQTAAIQSISESAADSTQGSKEDQGDSGWIELDAYSASVYYWSETGEGESSWQPDKFRIFIRRLANGDVVSAIGPGSAPPD